MFVFWSPDEISLAVKVDVQCKSFVSALLSWNSDITTCVHLQLISVKDIYFQLLFECSAMKLLSRAFYATLSDVFKKKQKR